MSSIPAHNSNGINVVQKRRCQAPTLSNGDGCQSPMRSRLMRKGVPQPPWRQELVPAPRLVGIELNPGPNGKVRKAAVKRVAKQQQPKKKQQKRARRASGPGMAFSSVRNHKNSSAKGANKITRSVFVKEEEYIADVTLTSAGFTNLQYSANPGNAIMFPWLSTIAVNFNKYRFSKLLFRYRPIVSGYATAGQTGDIILSFNPDASDPAPVAQSQVYDLQMRDNDEPCAPFALNKLSIAEINKQDSYYVRAGAAPANTDIKTYDVGNLNVSTTGTATSGTCGKLFVDYEVLLHSPVLVQPTSSGAVHFSSIASTSADSFSGSVLQSGGSPAFSGITTAANVITFPAGIPGNYLMVMTVAGATSSTAWTTATGAGGVSGLSTLTQSAVRDAVNNVFSLAGTTTNPVFLLKTFTLANATGTITLSPLTITGTGSMDLFILSLPTTLLTSVLPPSDREVSLMERLARVERCLQRMPQEPCQTPLSDDEFEPAHSSSSSVKPGASLSDSTLGLIGALIARKSTSSKKE
jgi:hypothetical protein